MKNKKFFIFIFFFMFFIFVVSVKSWDDVEYIDPCKSDSWVLYENEYKDTIIITDPYK